VKEMLVEELEILHERIIQRTYGNPFIEIDDDKLIEAITIRIFSYIRTTEYEITYDNYIKMVRGLR
jgi:hypothetical protein